MHTRLAVTVVLLLAFGRAPPTDAQQTLSRAPPEQNCAQDLAMGALQASSGYATVATVIQVDHQHGLLHLETERGRVLAFATPEDIADLQEGDQLMVGMAAAEAAENLPHEAYTEQ